jgi:phosphatidylserine/phosphatidylglycerophosphate/cardiolipin synthase-like enzyme
MFRRSLASSVALVTGVAAAAIGLAAVPASAAAPATYTLFTEPDQGFSPVYNLINGATTSIDLTMYELADTTAEQDLVAAEDRGVDVRVILDHREESENSAAYDYLKDNGVGVVWSSSAYYYTHEKSLVVDDSTAVIMTANLTSEYYSTSRDFGIIDTDTNDVAAIAAVFNADYAHTAVTPGDGDDLVWSPTNSQTQLLALINGATTSLQIYSEEMDDTAIESALVKAAERGVDVQLVGENEDGEYDSAYTKLADAGVQISYYSSSTGFYIHGKVIEADYGTADAKVFIGSENFSSTSLNENRELGLIISDPTVMSSIASTFASDFSNGTKWS